MIQYFKMLYAYFRPYRRLFGIGFLCLIIMNGMSYLIPQGVRFILDDLYPHLKAPGGLAKLMGWSGLLVLISLIRAGFLFNMIYCFWSTGTKLVNDLRNRLYDKLQRLPFSFYDTARTGDIMSRLTLDIEAVRNFYAFIIEHTTQIWMYFFIVTGLLLLTDWRLALACLAVTPFAIIMILKFSRKMRAAVKLRQAQAGKLNAMVQESITGIRVVKAFAMEDAEITKFRAENEEMRRRNLSVSKLQTILQPFLVLCSTLGTMIILWYGGIRVVKGEMTLGTLVAFMSYLAILNWPLWMLAPNTNQQRQVEGSTHRLMELMNQPEPISSPINGGIILPNIQGRIQFEEVTFGYNGFPIIKEICLDVGPGETVAIIGLTGSGKSTLINLIPRFYDPQSGKITVDGVGLCELNLEWWRRQVGLVLQETFLFSATIFDNIAFGKPEATMEEVILAAEAAQIHDFIVSLPQRYQTIIGERGVGLSGGQKQRVAIARALLTEPKILIMDDSTSSVDAQTEHAIQDALQRLLNGRTTLIITQRLSTARLANRIIILEDGEIRDQGGHDELLERDDFYRQLYQVQTFQEETLEGSC